MSDIFDPVKGWVPPADDDVLIEVVDDLAHGELIVAAGSDVMHLFCCNENEALCGADLSGLATVGYDETKLCPDCYVEDSWARPCLRCPIPTPKKRGRK